MITEYGAEALAGLHRVGNDNSFFIKGHGIT